MILGRSEKKVEKVMGVVELLIGDTNRLNGALALMIEFFGHLVGELQGAKDLINRRIITAFETSIKQLKRK